MSAGRLILVGKIMHTIVKFASSSHRARGNVKSFIHSLRPVDERTGAGRQSLGQYYCYVDYELFTATLSVYIPAYPFLYCTYCTVTALCSTNDICRYIPDTFWSVNCS